MSVRWLALVVFAALVAGCGAAEEGGTTASSQSTATMLQTTTSSPGSSSTTQLFVGSDLVLRGDGLGPVDFGEEMDTAMDALTSLLGSPTSDTFMAGPWLDRTGCAGATGFGCDEHLRFVGWDSVGLEVVFTDGSPTAEPAPPHMVGWWCWGEGLATAEGVTAGMTVGDLKDVAGDKVRLDAVADEQLGSWTGTVSGVMIHLSGDPDADGTRIEALSAGEASSSL